MGNEGCWGKGRARARVGRVGPNTRLDAPAALTCHAHRPQIDSFELLYYYDEYLGHSMW